MAKDIVSRVDRNLARRLDHDAPGVSASILEGLDDCFRLLTGGSRTGVPRQQTLRASVDWSYQLLSDDERVLLQRLSVFASSFTLDAAGAVAKR